MVTKSRQSKINTQKNKIGRFWQTHINSGVNFWNTVKNIKIHNKCFFVANCISKIFALV